MQILTYYMKTHLYTNNLKQGRPETLDEWNKARQNERGKQAAVGK